MQRVLIRHLNDFYEEYFFSYGEYRGYNAYSSTEKLLAHSGYSSDLIKLICGKYASSGDRRFEGCGVLRARC